MLLFASRRVTLLWEPRGSIINRTPNQLARNMETLSYSDSGVDAVRQRATSQPKASFGKKISLIKIVQIMFGLQQSQNRITPATVGT